MSPSAKNDLKLAYLTVTSPMPNVFIGGVMVTDNRGLPIEFRYTDPIQPTRIQQILYGQVLSAYIKREVILETLVKSIESKFKCLLVEDENLVNYPGQGFSIIRLSETKSAPLGEIGKVEKISDSEMLLQTSEQGSPLRLYLAKPAGQGNSSALSGGSEGEPNSTEGGYTALVEAGQQMDVYEPMKRIQKALEVICQEAGISATS